MPDTGQTSLPMVFAGGELVSGGSTIVNSLHQGMLAGERMHAILSREGRLTWQASNLRVKFCGVPLINPFLLASSPITDQQEMVARGFEAGWAGAVLKTTTHPSEENSIAYPMMAGLDPGSHLVGLHNTDLSVGSLHR